MSRPRVAVETAPAAQGRGVTLLLLVVGAGVFLGTFDQTVVVTILPNIVDSLGLPVSHFGEATWIVNGYLLGYAAALPLAGGLADAYGRVRVYLGCLAVFLLGSLLVALAPSLPLLVLARTFQALGGGGLLPVAMAIAAEVLRPGRRPIALGAMAAANNASSLLGPLWGAALAGTIGWRGIFWLNVPLILPVAVAVPWLARGVARSGARPGDLRGGLLLVLAIGAATIALTDDGANPRPLAVSLAFGATAALAVALFVLHERRCQQPIVHLRSFKRPRVAVAMLIYFLIGGALIVALVDVPLMRSVLFHGTALQGGLDLMRLLLLLPIGGVAGGFLCVRVGRRPTAAAGLALALAGFLLARGWASPPSAGGLWLALGAIGFGLGLCDAPIVSTVLEMVAASERATAAAMLLVLWTCGMIVGLALLGTRGLGNFSSRAARLFRAQGLSLDPAALERLMRQTFDATFVGAALALALALVLACFLGGGRSRSLRWSPLAELEE